MTNKAKRREAVGSSELLAEARCLLESCTTTNVESGKTQREISKWIRKYDTRPQAEEHCGAGGAARVVLDAVVRRLPTDLTPLNLQAYFFNAFGACGCSEIDEMRTTLIRLMEWHEIEKNTAQYQTLYNEVGVFYLLAGMLDHLGLSEHGVAIRYPWLTPDGKRLLEALKRHTADEIHDSTGQAYDGCTY